MDDNKPGIKTTELWLTSITALVDVILATSAPNNTTIALIVCLTTASVVYLICRTVFKIARLKYQPDVVTNFKANPSASSKLADYPGL